MKSSGFFLILVYFKLRVMIVYVFIVLVYITNIYKNKKIQPR